MSLLFHFSVSLLILIMTASQWYLSLFIGFTLNEFMTTDINQAPLAQLLSKFTWRDFLYMTFGTTSFIDALIPFNQYDLPLTGLEWAYILDNIDCNGSAGS